MRAAETRPAGVQELIARHSRKRYAAVASAVVFVVEVPALQAVLDGRIEPLTGLLFHSGIVLALFVWAYFGRKYVDDITWPLLLAASTAVMGPLGSGGVLLTMGLRLYFRRSATPFDEWYASLFPQRLRDPHLALLADIQLGNLSAAEGFGVASFIDILGFGTLPQKQELVAVITHHFRPAFAPALKMALSDASNAIRVQAASAVARIEDEFMTRSFELGQAAARKNRPQELLRFAVLHDEYAGTGLLDVDREADSRERALEAYRAYIAVEPASLEARAAIGRLLIQSGNIEEAEQWLAGCLKENHRSHVIILSYMETLFRLNKFSELRDLARQYSDEIVESAGFMANSGEAVKLWAHGTPMLRAAKDA